MTVSRTLYAVLLAFSISGAAASNDVGRVKLPNSGAAGAQAAFHHGLAQLHNFEYDSAANDFRRARKIDPEFALAYWGEAMTYNHPIWMRQDRDAGRAVLAKLGKTREQQLARAKTPMEKDLVKAAQILYGDGDKKSRDFLYRDHMASLYEKYPDNADVGAFYALSLLGTAHDGRDFAIYMKSAAVSMELFAKYPQHPGLAHYLIHATDDPIHAPLGYNAALAYSKIAPNAAHAQHMTSHIFLALGLWQKTADANDNAVAVVNRQRAADGRPEIGCGHYPSWQMYAYLQQGRIEEATGRMRLCHQRTAARNSADAPGEFYYMKALYLFDTEDWRGEIAGLDIDRQGDKGLKFRGRYLDAATALHADYDNAEKVATAAIETGREYLETFKRKGGGERDGHAATRTRVRLLHLKAWVAGRAGAFPEAESYWREAAALEQGLPFGFGPPNPAKPALESLAEFLLSQARYEEAAEVYREALARTPNRTRSQRGLALAMEQVQSGSLSVRD